MALDPNYDKNSRKRQLQTDSTNQHQHKKRKIKQRDDDEKLLSDTEVENWCINQYAKRLSSKLNKFEQMKFYFDKYNPDVLEVLLSNIEEIKSKYGVKNRDINKLLKFAAISYQGFAKIYYYRSQSDWLRCG